MLGFTVRRLAYSVLVVFGAISVIFIILRLIPGNPAMAYAGPLATPKQIHYISHALHFDLPVYQQYGIFVSHLLHLDLGESYRLNQSSASLVLARIPATALLASSAMVLALVLSFPLGILAATRARSRLDNAISIASLVGQSLPNFWIGLVAILVFSVKLRLLPTGGIGGIQHLIMPAVVVALPLLGILVRLVRAGLIEVLGEPFILTARAKGLTGMVILFRHALRNMLIPVITVIGLQLGQLLSGTVIVEVVFAWPGVGRLLIDSITNQDFAVVQTVILFVAIVFVVLNLGIDLLYGLLDPRVRVGGR